MKVRIDRERGPSAEGPKWYFSTTGEPPAPSKPRFASYPETKAAALAAGHEIDNAGWKHRLLMWNWNMHAIDGYPSWEIENPSADRYERHPAFVRLEHRRKSEDAVESHKLAAAWDDIAEADFYQRDWTSDNLPSVADGDVYWSGWWFQTIAERGRFVEWHRSQRP